MDSKLTLSLNKQVIEKAKEYARKHKISLSRLIESYLAALTQNKSKGESEITPLVKSFIGVIGSVETNTKEDFTEYLDNKYK